MGLISKIKTLYWKYHFRHYSFPRVNRIFDLQNILCIFGIREYKIVEDYDKAIINIYVDNISKEKASEISKKIDCGFEINIKKSNKKLP